MKRILLSLLAVCGCLMFSACANRSVEESEDFVIKRGTNLSHWLSQSFVVGEARAQRVTEDWDLLTNALDNCIKCNLRAIVNQPLVDILLSGKALE